ncbi:Gfo/Idh/MocA family oxidoreductase [Aestuariivivens sediminicola]|uniref:Gfo/Idh/MocA family oxidoreductase n=1 Tax=Aestuariivivens sediminicola TaxID=2913560 RepID=UPI001F59A8D3|nr:Gfo/Idh/MocA family oxidoreductase [Aestuariivivens sediminicola]
MKSINTALCAFGMSGQLFHAPFIDVSPKFKLHGVLERSKNLAEAKYPDVMTYRRIEELLEDKNVDLVIVNTPNITHYEFAKKVILSGKHVIIEKPFTASVTEAKSLIDLAEQHNVKLSVFHNRRWDSDFKTVEKIINAGVLGEIVEAEFHYDRFSPSLSYKVHKEIPSDGVGNIYDLGSHIIDQALVLFGMPQKVFAVLDTRRKDSKVDDYFDIKLFYPSHYVNLKSSYFVLEPLPAYSVHGKKGSFVKSKSDVQENDLQSGKMPDTMDWGVEPDAEKGLLHTLSNGNSKKSFIHSERGDYMAFYDEVYEAIRFDKPMPVSGYEAMNVIKIIQAAIESHLNHRIIEV